MENDSSPVSFECNIEDNGTATEECAIGSNPVSPNSNDSLIPEKKDPQDSKTDQKPLKSSDVSLTLSDDVNGDPVWLQIDEETVLEENREMGWKQEFVERVKRACILGIGGVIFVPIITGETLL